MFNTECRYKKGYTLAEMLMVLVIFALMMIALPPLTKKMFKVDTVPKAHGRFECYYNASGNLIQYLVKEDGTVEYTNRTAAGLNYCEFLPPSNSIYTMIHAVGGGGAGYRLNTASASEKMSVNDSEAFSYLYYSVPSFWPEWFKYLLNNKSGLDFDSDYFEAYKTFRGVSLPYGNAGEAGEKVSMFFPRLKGLTIRMKPGRGGARSGSSGAGGDGTATTVQFKYASDTSYSDAIVAAGGKGGKISGKYGEALMGGNATDYGVSKLSAVKSADSGFDTVIEDPGLNNTFETRINVTSGTIKGHAADWGGINAGWGGNGDYYIVSSSLGGAYDGKFSYLVNNYNQSVSSSGDTFRKDNWTLVTDKIKEGFYSRDGIKANCDSSLSSGKIKVHAWCSSLSGVYAYVCKIMNINKVLDPTYPDDTEYDINVDASGNVLNTPAGYTNCKFELYRNLTVCESASSVSNAYRTCSFTQGASSFNCPYGVRSGNMCQASSGGNGAVLILW